MMRRRHPMILLPLVLATLTGCVSVRDMVNDLSKSKRSWCLYWAGTPGISGPVVASGSGVEAEGEGTASADCSPQGHKVNMNNAGMGQAGAGAVLTPNGDVILRSPRVYRQPALPLEDVTPEIAPPARRAPAAPAIRPQSGPRSYLWEGVLETSASMHR